MMTAQFDLSIFSQYSRYFSLKIDIWFFHDKFPFAEQVNVTDELTVLAHIPKKVYSFAVTEAFAVVPDFVAFLLLSFQLDVLHVVAIVELVQVADFPVYVNFPITFNDQIIRPFVSL